MPTYDYRCRDCGHEFEIQQSFSDDALTECPVCHGPFLVNLEGKPAPPSAPPPPDPADGRLLDYCPQCGYAALNSESVGGVVVQTCAVCGKRSTVGRVKPPLPHPAIEPKVFSGTS